jgi:hypothetical protein
MSINTTSGARRCEDGLRCDIFCRVVDNFGDIGVVWRLARQLSDEFGWRVRVVVDDLVSFQRIEPRIKVDKHKQRCGFTDILCWNSARDNEFYPGADVVIEAFACELPQSYVKSMAARSHVPHWINLEYLSAEAWVDEHHLLPSPHPRLDLVKHFFFPGFTSASGGLLRERDLSVPTAPSARPARVFVFGYASQALHALVGALSASSVVESITMPQGALADTCGAIDKVQVAPFVPQVAFDTMLQQHDLLVVRGEDSFVRAQWAAKPFVWHIYPQQEGAHIVKLNAFLARYCADLSAPAAAATHRLWHLVNEDREPDAVSLALAAWLKHWDELARHALQWEASLRSQTDLGSRLSAWVESRAKKP